MSGQVSIGVDLLDSLTLGDIEDVEELAGIGFGRFRDGAGIPARAIRALAFVVRRKQEPRLTFDDCRAMTMNELIAVIQTQPGKAVPANGVTPATADA